MAKKAASAPAPNRGFNDIIGIVLMGSAILLLIALLSYDPHDLRQNVDPANHPARNWIGPIGAWVAYQWLLWVGASAYVLPFILMFLGLGCFFEALGYVRRRWIWTLVLFVCCMGMFDLYKAYFGGIKARLSITPGGVLGTNLNQYIFNDFGTV